MGITQKKVKYTFFLKNIYIFLSDGFAEASLIYTFIWIGVLLIISFAFYLGIFKHKASEEDRQKYIELLNEGAVLSSVLDQSRLN